MQNKNKKIKLVHELNCKTVIWLFTMVIMIASVLVAPISVSAQVKSLPDIQIFVNDSVSLEQYDKYFSAYPGCCCYVEDEEIATIIGGDMLYGRSVGTTSVLVYDDWKKSTLIGRICVIVKDPNIYDNDGTNEVLDKQIMFVGDMDYRITGISKDDDDVEYDSNHIIYNEVDGRWIKRVTSVTSSDPNVCKVKEYTEEDDVDFKIPIGSYIFTAIKPGNTTITIHKEIELPNGVAHETATYQLEVKNETISTSKKKLTIAANKTIDMKKYVSSDGNKNDLIWESKNKKIARIDDEGKLIGISLGKTDISCKVGSSGQTIKWTLYVNSDTIYDLAAGESLAISNCSKNIKVKSSKWKSNNKKIVKIKGKKIYGLKKGTAKISCKYNDVKYTLIVKVQAKALSKKEKTALKTAAVSNILKTALFPKTVSVASHEYINRHLYTTYTCENILGKQVWHKLETYKKNGKYYFKTVY